ncbi:AraC family transcriptional regulator [Chitinimonas sp.]|uniref:AraC family transcriptional regulator n=1 Tax=Chitinimonas sp. TaxID=1934313 RepID=UPI0035B3798B
MSRTRRPPAAKAALEGSVPATYVRLLFDYLAAHGRDAQTVLGEAPPAADASCPALHWRQLLETAATAIDDPTLGLRVGATITAAHLGPLGYVLAASSSVAEALGRYIRYQRLVHDVSPVSQRLHDGRLLLEWGDDARHIGLLANQCGLAALVQFARKLTGRELKPLAVHFVETTPADYSAYQAYFGCPVLFEQERTCLQFADSLLQQRLVQPDPALLAMLEQQVEALYAAMPARDPLLRRLQAVLSQALPAGEPGLAYCAKTLQMSERTLRRRLAALDLPFRDLLEDTRWQLAQSYLRDARLSLPDIALLLGYSEQSAFNRAFRRWSGTTPRLWREMDVVARV